jgi:hypothetical protein
MDAGRITRTTCRRAPVDTCALVVGGSTAVAFNEDGDSDLGSGRRRKVAGTPDVLGRSDGAGKKGLLFVGSAAPHAWNGVCLGRNSEQPASCHRLAGTNPFLPPGVVDAVGCMALALPRLR